MREQEIDGVLAQIPCGRAVAARLAAGQSRNRLVGAHEIGLLFRPTLPRRGNVRPAMVRHFMAVPHDVLASLRMALDGEARNEPGRPNAARAQQMPDALRADQSELAARERRRARHPARNEPRLGIEGEREEYDMARPAGSSACYALRNPTPS